MSSLGFTGHVADLDLGLVNMKGRIYDPKLGRFLTPDPLVPRPCFGQSWNGYSYVLNSPLSLVDPSRFQEQPPATEGGCSQGCTIWVFGPPREPKPPEPPKVVEGTLEEAAAVVPAALLHGRRKFRGGACNVAARADGLRGAGKSPCPSRPAARFSSDSRAGGLGGSDDGREAPRERGLEAEGARWCVRFPHLGVMKWRCASAKVIGRFSNSSSLIRRARRRSTS
ncbi:uncharacterized protein CMC5_069520 [Chondromyces crocatus]|uniref:RHS repeat-associated core domain-containing protein n=1 Tax=Chondromyces crocatus TaxID=52 RepID=A0A0K1EP85_CHOCO|nr:uncharacterized protein CMC5_069520 [Chondromyces crocatus]